MRLQYIDKYMYDTQKGGREFYLEHLKTIYAEVDIDPNSTFGKLFMKKMTPKLRSHRKQDKNIISNKNEVNSFERNINSTIQEKSSKKSSVLYQKRLKKQEKRALNNFYYRTYYRFRLDMFFIFFPLLILIILIILKYYISALLSTGLQLWLVSIINNTLDKILASYKDIEQEAIDEFNVFQTEITTKKRLEGELIQKRRRLNRLKNDLKCFETEIKQLADDLLNDDQLNFILGAKFYTSVEWRKLREEVLQDNTNICFICGNKKDLTIDHIKPRSKYPKLALKINNLQILCRSCNSSKGAKI